MFLEKGKVKQKRSRECNHRGGMASFQEKQTGWKRDDSGYERDIYTHIYKNICKMMSVIQKMYGESLFLCLHSTSQKRHEEKVAARDSK